MKIVTIAVLLILSLTGMTTGADINSGITFSEKNENGRFYNIIDLEFRNISSEAEFCLAQNIFFEAGIESLESMAAVADVTLNRVENSFYPNTVCEVVYQSVTRESWTTKQYPDLPEEERVYTPVRNKCQFSWYCDGKSDIVPSDTNKNWNVSKLVAYTMLNTPKYRGITSGSTHYHATYVVPNWINDRGMKRTGQFGRHIFYKWH